MNMDSDTVIRMIKILVTDGVGLKLELQESEIDSRLVSRMVNDPVNLRVFQTAAGPGDQVVIEDDMIVLYHRMSKEMGVEFTNWMDNRKAKTLH